MTRRPNPFSIYPSGRQENGFGTGFMLRPQSIFRGFPWEMTSVKMNPVDIFFKVGRMAARCPESRMHPWAGFSPQRLGRQ